MLPIQEAETAAAGIGVRPEMAAIHFYRLLFQSPIVGRVEHEINEILWKGVLAQKEETRRLRELVIMRIAWATGCEYMWAHHFSPVVDKGIPGIRPADVLRVRQWQSDPELSDLDRLVLRGTDEMIQGARVEPETLAALREHLSDPEATELIYVMAIWRAIASIMFSVGVTIEPGYESWPPDGLSPEGVDREAFR